MALHKKKRLVGRVEFGAVGWRLPARASHPVSAPPSRCTRLLSCNWATQYSVSCLQRKIDAGKMHIRRGERI